MGIQTGNTEYMRERKFLMIALEYGNISAEDKIDIEKELARCNNLLEKSFNIKQKYNI
jgi:hypothetical protein